MKQSTINSKTSKICDFHQIHRSRPSTQNFSSHTQEPNESSRVQNPDVLSLVLERLKLLEDQNSQLQSRVSSLEHELHDLRSANRDSIRLRTINGELFEFEQCQIPEEGSPLSDQPAGAVLNTTLDGDKVRAIYTSIRNKEPLTNKQVKALERELDYLGLKANVFGLETHAGTYSGQIIGVLPSGTGHLKFHDGRMEYSGQWDAGQRSGTGELKTSIRANNIAGAHEDFTMIEYSFQGEWKNDLQEGQGKESQVLVGKKRNLNAYQYVGNFHHGKRDGKGDAKFVIYDDNEWKHYFKDLRYEGTWESGTPQKGTLSWPNKNAWMKGTWTPSQHNCKFEGELHTPEYTYRGTFTTTLLGQIPDFVDGDFSGTGTLESRKHHFRYEGNFLNGCPGGYGTLTKEGDVAKGNWKVDYLGHNPYGSNMTEGCYQWGNGLGAGEQFNGNFSYSIEGVALGKGAFVKPELHTQGDHNRSLASKLLPKRWTLSPTIIHTRHHPFNLPSRRHGTLLIGKAPSIPRSHNNEMQE